MREIPNGTCFSNQRMYAPLPEKKNEGRQRSRMKRVKNNSFFFFRWGVWRGYNKNRLLVT